jgi:prophage DNA circulation protein
MATEPEGWLNRLESASFRGVPFHTKRAEKTVGRRLQVNEYPARERPYVEDLGRRVEVFRIDAFVVGPDYDLARDKLLSALAEPGPGELITERHGRQTVAIDTGSVSEESAEGRYARIRFSALEYGVRLEPAASAATAEAIGAATEAAAVAVLTQFIQKLEPAVGWVRERITDRVVEAVEEFQENALELTSRAEKGVDLDASARLLIGQVGGGDSVSDLGWADELALTGSALIDLYYDFAKLEGSPGSRLRLLDELRSVDSDLPHSLHASYVPGGDDDDEPADRVQDRAYHEGIATLARCGIVAARAIAGLEVELTSLEETRRLRDDLLGPLDDEIAYAGANQQDEAYEGLRILRNSILVDLRTRGETLPERATYTPPVTISSLLLSQRLYGTGARNLELVAALKPKHPAFLVGGDPLRVLRE